MQNPKSTDSEDGLPPIVWNEKVPDTHLEKFKRIVEEKYGEHFESYWEFHQWSIKNFESYWKEVWNYLRIIHSKPYDKIYEKTGPGFLDCEWFIGARFNYAENILRIRDESVAIIYADAHGFEETVTYAEMYEEVKLYAAAFKKNGLRKGDVVACYMSNRKESIFYCLAAASIGAIFGGPVPYLQSKPASDIIKKMEAKFLLAVDHATFLGLEYHTIDKLPYIVDNNSTLVKVIIVPTRSETFLRDISNIRNSCLLGDFLESGRTSVGSVPDLDFEQLPFGHPVRIDFTSGTTGLPKGIVKSAGTIISHTISKLFYGNLNEGDVMHSMFTIGWSMWSLYLCCLTRGVTLFLDETNMLSQGQRSNIWDTFSRFKVTYSSLPTNFYDKMEKDNIVPSSSANLENLKTLLLMASPSKAQNYLFLRNKIKKDVFICSQYGATETSGAFTGFDYNLPCYAGEVQALSLGMDVRCFNEEGKSVVGQRGEMVVATPTPSLPLYLWRDEGNKLLQEIYLFKYPGVWCQHDEIWINPKTKGLQVMGRSDDTIKINGLTILPGDIYAVIHDVEEIRDSICVGQSRSDGECRAVLFLKMREGCPLTEEITRKVQKSIADELWCALMPELILETKDIPYNFSNKRMESVVRKILSTNRVPDVRNIRNPECLEHYCDIPEILNY